jgi:two-component system nitrate/nitrite response regulator NarL
MRAGMRILLGDAHSLFREAVKAVLERELQCEVVCETSSGVIAVSEASREHPDIAILDADLPECDGIRAAGLIREQVPDCKVLILSAVEDQDVLLSALEAGASGFVTKTSPLSELIDAANSIAAGRISVPSQMLGSLLDGLMYRRKDQDAALKRMNRLTKREKEVLLYLAKGAGNEQIAEKLVISRETARTHIQNILSKLGVHSRLEAAALALQNGNMSYLGEDEDGGAGDDVPIGGLEVAYGSA